MYHVIEFTTDLWVDLERLPKHLLERMKLHRGTRRRAQLRPFVLEAVEGPVEVADLFFEDDTTARAIPFTYFAFAE